MISFRTTSTLAVAAIICACAGDGPNREGATVRDSAGIRIVENTAPAWDDADTWHLSEQPLVDIGGLENDTDYELYRVSNAIRLPDGRIVVGNAGTDQIRFYDQSGVHLVDVGAEGEGPGEFHSVSWVRPYRRDSVAVHDRDLGRVSIFDAAGRFVRSLPVRARDGSGMARADDVFADGSVLARGIVSVPAEADRKIARSLEPTFIVNPEGEFEDSLFAYPGSEMYAFHTSNLVFTGPPLFARSSRYDVHGNRVYAASNEQYEIRVHTLDGRLESIWRKAHDHLEVTDADVAALREQQLDGDTPTQMRVLITEVFNSSPLPATMPAYDAILLDSEGNLWVEEYNSPADNVPRWTIFNAEGEFLGTMSLPERFVAQEAGGDYVLGSWKDELDIEHVQLYELVKP